MTTAAPARRHRRAPIVAIDGPAASGKTAVGVRVAARLGYRFVDTGAMYRAMTWLALRRTIDVHDTNALAVLASRTKIEVGDSPAGSVEPTAVVLDGHDATPHLRDDDVDANVSFVSRVPGVRSALVRIQRELAERGRVVMAGRDIGTVVLPGARLKIYLDASVSVRAERRAQQLHSAGIPADLGALQAELARRDSIDSSRDASPLTPAEDAVIIHTDGMSVDEVVERIVELAT
jgi:cytidylate kinase